MDCSFQPVKEGMAGYREWTNDAPVQDFIESPRLLAITGEQRMAGVTRMGSRPVNQRCRDDNTWDAS